MRNNKSFEPRQAAKVRKRDNRSWAAPPQRDFEIDGEVKAQRAELNELPSEIDRVIENLYTAWKALN